MLTSLRIARAIDDARTRAAAVGTLTPISPRQKQLAKLHVRGSLVRVRCELTAISPDADHWKVRALEHRVGYRLGTRNAHVHCTITLMDEMTMVVETLGCSGKAVQAPLNATGWGIVSTAVDAWVRDLAGLGMLTSALPSTVAR